jgi:hypothetical protein
LLLCCCCVVAALLLRCCCVVLVSDAVFIHTSYIPCIARETVKHLSLSVGEFGVGLNYTRDDVCIFALHCSYKIFNVMWLNSLLSLMFA